MLTIQKPTVRLIGIDGNAFVLIGACRVAAKKSGWSDERIKDLTTEMMSGDYDNLLITATKHFEVL